MAALESKNAESFEGNVWVKLGKSWVLRPENNLKRPERTFRCFFSLM